MADWAFVNLSKTALFSAGAVNQPNTSFASRHTADADDAAMDSSMEPGQKMVRGQRAGCGERDSSGPCGGERDRREPGKGTDALRGKGTDASWGKGPTRSGGKGQTLAGERDRRAPGERGRRGLGEGDRRWSGKEGSGTHRKFAVSSRLLDGCQRREDSEVARCCLLRI